MPVSKPTPGATGWNTAVDAVIDIANSVADLPTRVTALEAGGIGDVTEAELAAGLATKAPTSHVHTDLLDQATGDNRYVLQTNANAFAQADATTTALAGKQSLDADLTALAGLDSATAGTVASDGAGWVKKTYAQLKTALGLVKGDVGLGNVDNTSDANKPVSTATQTALNAKATASSLATIATSGKLADTTDLTTSGAAVGKLFVVAQASGGALQQTGLTTDVGRQIRDEGFVGKAVRNSLANLSMPRAVAYQTFVTPTGGTNEVVHPSLYYNAQKWNGYPYWMAITPYQGGDNQFENPCIYVSNDGDTWTTPPGLTNPIEPTPADGYNSDPNLVMVDGTLHLFWRSVFATAAQEIIYVRTSTDGITWTPKTAVITSPFATRRPAAPAFVYSERGGWLMFAVDFTTDPNRLLRWSGLTLAALGAATPTVVPLSVTGRDIWHLDVKRWGHELHMLVQDCALGNGGGFDGELYFAVSRDDGLTWTLSPTQVMPKFPGGGTWDRDLYKSTLVPTVVDGHEGYDIWYGTSAPEWRVGRTRLLFDGHRDQTSGAVHGAFDIRHVNLLAAFRGLGPYVVGDSFARGNSTTTLGNADSGQPWTASAGTWGVTSGKAAAQAAANSRALIDSGLADCVVECDFSGVTVADQAWMAFRAVDGSNYLRLGNQSGGSVVLQKIVAGAVTQIGASLGSRNMTARFGVILNGSTITVTYNGTVVGIYSDPFNATATQHGFQTTTTLPRFDNFTVRALVNGT